MLLWTWPPMRCSTTNATIIWRMPGVSTTTPSPGECSTTSQSSFSASSQWSLTISVSETCKERFVKRGWVKISDHEFFLCERQIGNLHAPCFLDFLKIFYWELKRWDFKLELFQLRLYVTSIMSLFIKNWIKVWSKYCGVTSYIETFDLFFLPTKCLKSNILTLEIFCLVTVHFCKVAQDVS